jgi:hypothetical protein
MPRCVRSRSGRTTSPGRGPGKQWLDALEVAAHGLALALGGGDGDKAPVSRTPSTARPRSRSRMADMLRAYPFLPVPPVWIYQRGNTA